MGRNTDNSKPLPPKRPLTAFFLFKEDVVEEVKQSNPESTFMEIVKIIAERWKNLDEAIKLGYEKRNVQNKAKYEQEVKEYVEKYGPIEKKRRKTKRRDDSEDEGKKHNSGDEQEEEVAQNNHLLVKHNTNNLRPPKRSLTAFFLYKQAKYEEVKKANPDAKITQIIMIISEMWKGLDEATKKEYEKLHEQHVANNEKELKEYQEAMNINTPLNAPKGMAKNMKSKRQNEDKEKESVSDSEEELEEPTKKKKKTFSE